MFLLPPIIKLIKIKNMYKQQQWFKNTLQHNKQYEGETIEQKVNRITNNKEPIKDGAPLIYQDRSEGVQPDYDIRTDRFEAAIDAMDKVAKTHRAKREERAKTKLTDQQKGTEKKDGEAESTQATDNA